MGLSVNILRDADEADHGPLFEFLLWCKQYDRACAFGCHYDMPGTESSILDLGMLKQELDDYFEDPQDNPPPDIREYLEKEVAERRCLAWVGW